MKKEYKVCCILHLISSILFAASAVLVLKYDGVRNNRGISFIGLSITFLALAIMYFKKYKNS